MKRTFSLAIPLVMALVFILSWAMTTGMAIDFYRLSDAARAAAWGAQTGFPALLLMWTVMMAAMMMPAFFPAFALLLRLQKQQRAAYSTAPVSCFVAAYFFIWTGFSAAAAVAQQLSAAAGMLDTELFFNNPAWRGGLLVAAGIYQFTPLKSACLSKCRHPVLFLITRWRNTPGGGWLAGCHYGLYCLGCCWLLMMLLFVGGIMHIGYIIALTAFVFVEKTVPYKPLLFARVCGAALIVAGVWQFLPT